MNLKKILKKFKTDKRIRIIKKFIGKKTRILEIGVHEGTFSNLLLKEFKPEIFYLVDPWKYQDEELYKESLYGGNLSNLDGQKKLDDRYEVVKLNFKEQILSGQIILMRKNSDEIFNLLFCGLLFLVLIIEIFMPLFVSLIAPGFAEDADSVWCFGLGACQAPWILLDMAPHYCCLKVGREF